MAKTEFVFLQGKAKWARTITTDKFGKWGVVLYPTPESYEKILELKKDPGILNVVSKDEDGYFIRFHRKQNQNMRGKMVAFEPPMVLDANGQPIRDLIGNGSDVTIKLEVFGYTNPQTQKPGKAARLSTIRVDNLVPFTANKDFDEDQQKAAKGLQEQPAPLF